MMDRLGQEIAFKGIDVSEPFVPAFSMGAGQQAKVNFGQVSNYKENELLCDSQINSFLRTLCARVCTRVRFTSVR